MNELTGFDAVVDAVIGAAVAVIVAGAAVFAVALLLLAVAQVVRDLVGGKGGGGVRGERDGD